MSFSARKNAASLSAYTACSLRDHYRTIGRQLLNLEKMFNIYRRRSSALSTGFRSGVAFVPVEVLESYLDDLLDLQIGEEILFIYRDSLGRGGKIIMFSGVLLALGLGLFAAASGASLWLSFTLTACISLPFVLFWHFFPRMTLARRMAFAGIVAQEISRRKGRDKDGRSYSGSILDEIIPRRETGPISGAVKAIEKSHLC